jgi:hypothetical protein
VSQLASIEQQARIDALKQLLVAQREIAAHSPEQLLSLVVHFYLSDPHLMNPNHCRQEDNNLKNMLLLWCVKVPSWNTESLSKERDIRWLEGIKLGFSESRALSNLMYQIARFLQFGEYYYPQDAWHWDAAPRIVNSAIEYVVLDARCKLQQLEFEGKL